MPGCEVKVVSVLGRDPRETREFAEAKVIGLRRPLRRSLAGPEFEAVDLCLPNHLHHEAAVRTAQAGKHILCEKPLGRTAEEAERCGGGRAAGIIHCYGENMLFSPDMAEILSVS